ncbi:MAG: amino acid permease [Phycisphaerae bacterium]|nr:amino acid permease [Phycisphaerae bacterium]
MQQDELRRGFGLSTATYVVIASMVGVGILTTSGYIIKDTGSHAVLLGLWLVGGLLALCGALTVAELAAAMPQAGGEYVYIRETYGRPWAFLYGWISFLIGFSAPAAIASHAAASYLIAPWTEAGASSNVALARALAVGFIVLLTAAHLRGQRVGSRVQNLTTIAKILLLLALAVCGFALGKGNLGHLTIHAPKTGMPWGALGISLVYVMFSYSGWNAATYLAGEIREPRRILPRALLIGCGAVVALYLLLNLLYVYALPADAMPADRVETVAALAAERLFGPWIAAPLNVSIGIGLLASVSAFVLVGPRVYFAMAQDGLFPSVAARLDPKTAVPSAAILAQAACTLVLLFSGTFKNILTYAGVGLSISSFFVILAVFVLRIRRPDMDRPFRTPGYPAVPLLFLACTGWMIVFAFKNQPRWSTISLVSILAGIPVYYIWQLITEAKTK